MSDGMLRRAQWAILQRQSRLRRRQRVRRLRRRLRLSSRAAVINATRRDRRRHRRSAGMRRRQARVVRRDRLARDDVRTLWLRLLLLLSTSTLMYDRLLLRVGTRVCRRPHDCRRITELGRRERMQRRGLRRREGLLQMMRLLLLLSRGRPDLRLLRGWRRLHDTAGVCRMLLLLLLLLGLRRALIVCADGRRHGEAERGCSGRIEGSARLRRGLVGSAMTLRCVRWWLGL